MLAHNSVIAPQTQEQIDLVAIKTMIEARYAYILSHCLYLAKYQRKIVSEDQIIDYLRDVFGITIKDKNDLTGMIIKLNEMLNMKFKVYRELVAVFDIADQQQMIFTLAFTFEWLIKASFSQFSIEKKKNPTLENKGIDSVLYDYEFLQNLSNKLEAYIPNTYQIIKNVFSIITKTDKKSKIITDLYIQCQWDVIRNEFSSCLRRTMDALQKNLWQELNRDHRKTQKLRSIEDLNNFDEYLTDGEKKITSYEKKAAVIMSKDKIKEILTEENMPADVFENIVILHLIVTDIFKMGAISINNSKANINNKIKRADDEMLTEIRKHIDFFNRALPVINQFKLLNAKEVEKENAVKMYAKKMINVKNKITRLRNKINKIEIQLKNVADENKSEWNNHLSTCKTALDGESRRWPDDCPSRIKDTNLLREETDASNRVIQDCASQIKMIQESLQEYQALEAVTKIFANQGVKESSELVFTQSLQDPSVELFKHAQAEKIREYKQTIAEQRALKKAAKEKEREILSSSTSKEVKTATSFKNVTMEERLLNLSEHYWNMLTDIINQKSGTTYHEAKTLITNQLGGRFVEYGSSHKRIELNKYVIDMISSYATEDELAKVSLATGGMFKPHGNAHNSGILSHFNLGLIKQVFTSAGITLDKITQLQNMRTTTNLQM